MNTKAACAIGMGLAFVACGDTVIERVSPPVQVALQPSDRATSVRSALKAVVGLGSRAPGEEQLAVLRSRISIISESGTTLEVNVTEEPDNHVPQGRFLDIIPTTDLLSEWYEIHVDLRGTDMLPFVSLVPAEDGSYMARFRPDSAPVLQSVRICGGPKTADKQAVVEFSEPVDFVPSIEGVRGEIPIQIEVDGVPCSILATDNWPKEAYNYYFQFVCHKTVEFDALTLSVTRPLKAASGETAILSVGSVETTARFESANSFDDLTGCLAWHMP